MSEQIKPKIKSGIDKQKEVRERKWRRSERALKILEILTQGAATTTAILLAFAPGTTYQMARGINRLPKDIRGFFREEKERRRFYVLLNYLRRSGLIERKEGSGLFSWRITKSGVEKKNFLVRRLAVLKNFVLPTSTYLVEPNEELIAVIFDIPEKEKYKRDWLRSVLRNLKFFLVQESVWMGKTKIPSKLIKDLKKLNILSCVKIFSVVKIGNLD